MNVVESQLATVSNDWIPNPGSQVLFLASPVYETLFHGTRGAGKTDPLLMDFAQHTGQGYGVNWRGILFRQTYKQLSDLIAKSQRWFGAIFPGARWVGGEQHKWIWPTGEELLLRQMKKVSDYWNYHGHEYPWIGFEELTNWANLECYEAMKSCSRSSIRVMPRKMRSTCNPFGVGHNAVKSYFIDPAPDCTIIRGAKNRHRVAIKGSILENKQLMAADPDYYYDTLLGITSTPKRRAWAFGDWNIVAGGMFDDVYDADTHLLEPFAIPASWRIDRSFDWGGARPFSVGWWARSDGSPARVTNADGEEVSRFFAAGSIIRFREWYGSTGDANTGVNLTVDKIAEGILQREQDWGLAGRVRPGPADPSIWTENEGKSRYQTMAEHGVEWIRANNDRKNGWELCRVMLGACEANEDPGMYAFNTCRDFVRLFPSAPRDPEDMDDVDTDSEDHLPDEARYRAMHTHFDAGTGQG